MTPQHQEGALVERTKARKNGREWRAHCPVHANARPSLDFHAEGDRLQGRSSPSPTPGKVLSRWAVAGWARYTSA